MPSLTLFMNGQLLFIILALFSFKLTQRGITSPRIIFSRNYYDANWHILFSCSVDDGFPTITFHFEADLALHVYPHEYFFPNGVTWHFSPGGSVSVSCTVFLLVFLFSENSLSIPYQTSRLVLFDWFLISSVCPCWEKNLFNSRAIFFWIKVLYQTKEKLLKYL